VVKATNVEIFDSQGISHILSATFVRRALNEWIDSLWDNPDNKVESFVDSEKLAWAVEKAMGS